LPDAHPAGRDCITCHMTSRQAADGGHTVFTDHRISRRPAPDPADSADPQATPPELVAWRDPDPAFAKRNLALAYVNAGISSRSPVEIVRGYRMLTEVQEKHPDDIAVLRGIGRTLLLGKEPAESLKAFERVLQLLPDDPQSEEDAGVACVEAGKLQEAAAHLERALQLDRLQLSAASVLQNVYRRLGENKKADALQLETKRAR